MNKTTAAVAHYKFLFDWTLDWLLDQLLAHRLATRLVLALIYVTTQTHGTLTLRSTVPGSAFGGEAQLLPTSQGTVLSIASRLSGIAPGGGRLGQPMMPPSSGMVMPLCDMHVADTQLLYGRRPCRAYERFVKTSEGRPSTNQKIK